MTEQVMSKYKPQHSRILFVDRKISEGRYPNCRTLAEEWEVSRKTIQRDLDYMRYQLDAPIEYSCDKRGYYYTEKNFNLPALAIRESDLFAIYLAEKVLAQYEGTPIYDNLRRSSKKLRIPCRTRFWPNRTMTSAVSASSAHQQPGWTRRYGRRFLPAFAA